MSKELVVTLLACLTLLYIYAGAMMLLVRHAEKLATKARLDKAREMNEIFKKLLS